MAFMLTPDGSAATGFDSAGNSVFIQGAGLACVEAVPYADPRYYEPDGTPKDLAVVQEVRVAEAKAQAAALLAQTDWEMIRAIERAAAALLDADGQALAAEREAIRSASNEAEAEIAACEAVADLVAVRVDVMGEAIKSGAVRVETVEKMGIGAEEAPEQEVP